MFTLNKLLIALEDAAKITFEGEHFETGESVFGRLVAHMAVT